MNPISVIGGTSENFEYMEHQFDSLDAQDTPNAAYPKTDWPQFNLEEVEDLAYMRIIDVQIPFTYYVYNQFNNTFILTESTGGLATTVTIPPGNYNSATFIPMIITALNTASANHYTYTVTDSASTQKFTFHNSAGGTNTFSFTFGGTDDQGFDNPRLWIGFPAGTTTSTTAQNLVAPNAPMIQGPNYLYLCSDKGHQVRQFLTRKTIQGGGSFQGGSSGPQVCKIPVNVNAGGLIEWTNMSPNWFRFEGDLDQIDWFCTLGNDPRKIAFNGQSFSLKMGMLIEHTQVSVNQSGLYHQGRVVKRMRHR